MRESERENPKGKNWRPPPPDRTVPHRLTQKLNNSHSHLHPFQLPIFFFVRLSLVFVTQLLPTPSQSYAKPKPPDQTVPHQSPPHACCCRRPHLTRSRHACCWSWTDRTDRQIWVSSTLPPFQVRLSVSDLVFFFFFLSYFVLIYYLFLCYFVSCLVIWPNLSF